MSHPNCTTHTVPIENRHWKKVGNDTEVMVVAKKPKSATDGNKKRAATVQPTPSPPNGKRQALHVNDDEVVDEEMLSSESITMVDLQRLLHVMETNPAPKDRSKLEILMRADLCRDMMQKLQHIISDKDRQRVENACRAAKDVAQTMEDPLKEDLVEKIFLKPKSKIAVVESSSKEEEDEEPEKSNQNQTITSTTAPPKATPPLPQLPTVISPAAPSVAELQKQQREQIEEAIANMAAQMKDQTAKIHDTLRNQVGQLDEMEQIAETNVNELTDVAEATQQHVKASWGRTFSKWSTIFLVIAGFVGTLLIILMIPKRPGACLFFCPPPETQFCRILPGGRKECVDAPPSSLSHRDDVSDAHVQRDKVTLGNDISDDSEHLNDEEEEDYGKEENTGDDAVEYDENEDISGDHVEEDFHDIDNVQERLEHEYTPGERTQIVTYTDAAKAAVAGDIALLREYLSVSPTLLYQVDNNGWSLLHEAARMGQTETVVLLLEKGADLRQRTNTGQDALNLARLGGLASPELIDMILQHHQQQQQHKTPQEEMDCEVGVDGLCVQGSSPSNKAQDAHTVDDDAKDHHDKDGSISIFDFWQAVVEGDASRVAAFLKEYPDFLDEVDSENGWSGLHLAARRNRIDIVRLLLEEGADPSIESYPEGLTAYDIATQYFGDESPIAQLLAEYH
jgi:hypothetical protein